MWWQQVFPELPQGWVVERLLPPAQGLIFMNTQRLEYIKLSFARLRGANAIAQLNALLSDLRQQFQQLEASDLRADEARRVASCQVRFVQQGQPLQGTAVVLSGERGQALVLMRAARADLYPQVEKELERLAWSLLRRLTAVTGSAAGAGAGAAELQKAQAELAQRGRAVHVGLFWITIPRDWQVAFANNGNLLAMNSSGESVAIYILQVPADALTLQMMLQGLQWLGLTPQQSALLARLVSPYLPPLEVIRQLYPRLSGGSVQQLQILGHWPLPAAMGQAARVHYRYVRPAPAGAQPIEGGADVTSIPPPLPVPGATFWTLTAQGAEAPPALFAQRLPFYMAILASARPDPNGIQAALASQQQQSQIIQQMAASQAAHFRQQNQLIAQTFDNIRSMQWNLFEHIQQTNLNIALDWMDAFTGQVYVKDVRTGARFTVPREYADFFRERGEKIRAYGKYADPLLYGSYERDVLQPIYHGE
jgi:aryl carrier-like protein